MKPIDLMNIQRALISVHNKIGIVDFAKVLAARNVTILSTGGTAALLQKEGVPVQEVSDYTGFPEMMHGRLKTLHPKIHGGLLGRRGLDDEAMKKHDIFPIDLLVVNLYPFAETIKGPDCKLSQAIEQIDIGGPTMLRSAAKNFESVAAVVDPADYSLILEEMEKNQGAITEATRFQLAQKVFSYTAAYESYIANYLNCIHLDETKDHFPTSYTVQFTKKQDLRYGENPHQKAALYVDAQDTTEVGVTTAEQIQGKPLSYNNIADTNAALECIKLLGKNPACVIVKHANPCGAALADTSLEAYKKALACDPTSAFGGIIVFNKPLGAETVKAIFEKQFVEVLLAPSIEPQALPLLAQKPNVRVLATGVWEEAKPALDYARITGGLLVQERDIMLIAPHTLKVKTERSPSVQEFSDLLFAWEIAKCVKSNAIVYAKDGATLGIGAGQMSRVFSTIIAGLKATDAGFKLKGAVMASDAFFPFRDAIDAAAKAGITAIIQPGGSLRDEEVIQAANEANITMVFTGIRHFKH